MQIGEREIALLAELKDMPSYVLLMALLQEFENEVLEEVSLAQRSEELVRITRFYQCLNAIRKFLKTRPETAANAIQQVKQTYFDQSEVPQDVFRARFGNMSTGPDEVVS